MAAIYGILGDADESELQMMGERLAHRGSECTHWSVSPLVHLGRRCMPGRGDDAVPSLPICLDAVIENLDRLAQLLDPPNRTPTQESSAELALALYRKFGLEAFRHIRGPFSIALWDQQRDALVLARDPFGTRPLFYTRAGGRFFFATEYKALLAIPEVSAAPNLDTLQAINSTRTALPDASCLAQIFPVPPGHAVSLHVATVEKRRYWQPELSIAKRPDAEHVRAFRETYLATLRRQIASYPRIGVAVGGGVDAAAVVAGIRHVAPDRELHTFGAGFGPDDPEMIGAAETARHFDTKHHHVVVPADHLPDLLPKMTWHLEDPVGREDILYLYACAREATKVVDVLFGGHVADIMIGGMPRHLLVRLANLFPPACAPLEDLFRYTRTGDAPKTLIGKMVLKRYFSGGVFPPPRLSGTTVIPQADGIRVQGANPLSQFLVRAMLKHPGKGNYNCIHAAFGVDTHSPFYDLDMIRCVLQMPDRLKIRGRTQKYVQRAALKDLLPPSIARRPKSLARLRNDLMLTDAVSSLADRLFAPAAVRERGVFDLAYIDRLRQRPSGAPYPEEQLYRLWTMILTELWFRIFVDRRGAPPDGALY